MSGSEVDIVKRIYGFNWAAVGTREVGFAEIAAVVAPDFESRTSPGVGGRMIKGVDGLRDWGYALEQDFAELSYQPTEFIEAGGGRVIVVGRVDGIGRTSGMPLSGEFGHIWQIRDGLAQHVEAYRDAAEARSAGGK